MIETECQQLIIDAVQEDHIGGRGLKFNNRFIVGIVDLLIKLPGHQPMILEAKLHKFSAKTLAAGHRIDDIGATFKQKQYLRDWNYAGMLTGVVSFVMEQGADVRSLQMAIYSYGDMVSNNWSVSTEYHRPLGEKSERLINIRQQLIGFANGY